MNCEIIRTGEGIEYKSSIDHILVKTVGNLAEGRVSIIEDTLKPGFHLGRHHHKRMTEIFYILEGELTLIFDDKTVTVSTGTTISLPPNVWHEAKSKSGAKVLGIFSPAGFEEYLAQTKSLTKEQIEDVAFMQVLNEEYDIWNG